MACLTFSAAMSCLDAKISLVLKHKLIVPSTLLVPQYTFEQTRPQIHKARKIHTLRPLTYDFFFFFKIAQKEKYFALKGLEIWAVNFRS